MMEFKKPEYFKKIFKLGEPIFRKKTGNIISFSQYGRTGSAVDGNHGSPFIRFNTKNGEITGYYECLERTGINEFAEWQESLQINQKSIEEIFRFLEKKYLYESESPEDREAKL